MYGACYHPLTSILKLPKLYIERIHTQPQPSNILKRYILKYHQTLNLNTPSRGGIIPIKFFYQPIIFLRRYLKVVISRPFVNNSQSCSTVSIFIKLIPHLTISSQKNSLGCIVLNTQNEVGWKSYIQYQRNCIILVKRKNPLYHS